MHIGALLDKRPSECSGGEAQRVALARTIVNDPSVFSHGRAALEPRCEAPPRHAHGAQAPPPPAAGHVRLRHPRSGRGDDHGGPHRGDGGAGGSSRLERRSRSTGARRAGSSRGFFGVPTMNFLEGEVAAGAETASSSVRTRVVQPLSASTPAAVAGSAATLGVRAEHVRLAPSDDGAGRVTLTEPLGDETLVFFEFGGSAPLVAKVDPDSPLGPGDPVAFDFDRDWCHLSSTPRAAPVSTDSPGSRPQLQLPRREPPQSPSRETARRGTIGRFVLRSVCTNHGPRPGSGARPRRWWSMPTLTCLARVSLVSAGFRERRGPRVLRGASRGSS